MRILFLFIAISYNAFTNCNSRQAPAPGSPESVETKKPNNDYTPSDSSQTRAKEVKTQTAVAATRIAEGFEKPWAVIPFPGNNLLVTSKQGYMMIYDKTGKLLNKITGLPPVLAAGQGGLLDVALDPQFDQNRMLYWSFADGTRENNSTAVAKGRLSDDNSRIENPQVIFKQAPQLNSTLHYGSRLAFDKNGDLFVSSGERSVLQGRMQAQDLSSGLGKIFHITKDGKPAAGNPFINKAGARPEIYAYGIRNAQGLVINKETGLLWENEMGPKGGDEVNIIRSGVDYGWPTITYGLEYSGEKIGQGISAKAGMEQPVYYWNPSVSPSGMDFYFGDGVPEWKGNLFIGCLSGEHIVRLVLQNNKVVGEERLFANENQRFRDLTDGGDGFIYAVIDAGVLYRIGKQ